MTETSAKGNPFEPHDIPIAAFPDMPRLRVSRRSTSVLCQSVPQNGMLLRMSSKIASGVVHSVPADWRKALSASPKSLAAWNTLTPLARNEWICWITYVKKEETRKQHIDRAAADLVKGKRRPCCWPGCPHRPGVGPARRGGSFLLHAKRKT